MKKEAKKETCLICKNEFTVEAYISESACPDCFNGCCEPGYHNGRACNGEC